MHANQGYYQLTTLNDKKNTAESLYDQPKAKNIKTGKTCIDQYDLVLTGIRIVNATKPETWVVSYRRVNLDPRTRLCFKDWCKKIWHFVMAGTAFKEENVEPTPQQLFDLLPVF